MSAGETLLWVILPYATVVLFVAGHVWRYRNRQYTWTSRSSQLLESRVLRVGSYLFHLGAFAAIGGHVLGILVPASFTDSVGLTEDGYHVISATGGIVAGGAATIGMGVLIYRRLRFPRIRAVTSHLDVVVFALLAASILTGMIPTVVGAVSGALDYRETVSPWFRSLFTFAPEVDSIQGADLMFQIHVTLVWGLFALWPWSRLVHTWSLPVGYFRRSPVLYRSRTGVPVGVPTERG